MYIHASFNKYLQYVVRDNLNNSFEFVVEQGDQMCRQKNRGFLAEINT
jgi:hypothetical protein